MGLTRGERLARNQQKGKAIEKGVPSINDLNDGDSAYRDIDGKFIEYVKHGAQVFRKEYEEGLVGERADAGSARSSMGGIVDARVDGNQGFIKFDAFGIMLQWGGTIGQGDGGPAYVSFPYPFDNQCFQIYGSNNGQMVHGCGFWLGNNFGFYFQQHEEGTVRTYRWFAIGN